MTFKVFRDSVFLACIISNYVRGAFMDKEYWSHKIKGALLGKTIGENLGRPYLGAHEPLELTFYDPLPDPDSSSCFLDFQILWLDELSKMPHPVPERNFFAQCWLDHIRYYDAEYGIALRNLRNSIMPPWSGNFDDYFSDNFGAARRADLWAFLNPAKPDTALKITYEDSCVDHDKDGVFAAEFFAVLLSNAFIESNPDALLNAALAAIPGESRLAEAVRFTRELCARENDWKEARRQFLAKFDSENYEDGVMNTGFILLAYLLGNGDFEKTVLIAANCARNTPVNAGMAGELVGLLKPDSIPERWLAPVSEKIQLSDPELVMDYPQTLDAFIEQILELAPRIEAHTPRSCDQPDFTPFLIPVQFGIHRNWNRWHEILPIPEYLHLDKEYTIPGTFNYLDAFEVPPNSLYMMRFQFTIDETKKVRVIFNCNATSRVWVDGVYRFGRDGGWVTPSFDTVPHNQYCDITLEGGVHELLAGVAPVPAKPSETILWVMGIADCADSQWLPYAFFNN